MTTAILRAEITRGYVMVFVPEYDCDNMQRSIDFPRVGNCIYGTPRYHWTAKRYLRDARIVAREAIR